MDMHGVQICMDKCSLLLHKLTEELHLLHCAACSCVRRNV